MLFGISFEEYPIRSGSTLDGFGSAWGMFMTLHGEMYGLRNVFTGFQGSCKVLSEGL